MSAIVSLVVASPRLVRDRLGGITAVTSVRTPQPAPDEPSAGLLGGITINPVFVDTTGRRRRRLRRLAYGAGIVALAYTVLVGISFAGGPVSPETVLPFIDSTYRPEQVSPTLPTVSPAGWTGPAPPVTSSPS